MSSRAGTRARAQYRLARGRRRRRLGGAVTLASAAVAGHVVGWPGRLLIVVAAAASVMLIAAVGPRSGRDIDRWRRGAEGESWTAELLERLPSRRWAVWHDLQVPGRRSNIDHVVAGRTGVWVVDTKTTRAVARQGWRSVRFGDRSLDTGPARWEAEVVAGHIAEGLGRPVVVRPVVAVHDRSAGHPTGGSPTGGLRPRGTKVGGVRVVPASDLVARIRRGRRRISRRDLRAVAAVVDAVFGAGRAGRSTVGRSTVGRAR